VKKSIILLAVILIGVAAVSSSAQDQQFPVKKELKIPQVTVELKPGEGRDKVSVLCNICHSLDYITMQPLSPKAVWTASVTKMRQVMGAPISDADAQIIIQYLSTAYGK